MPSDCAKGCFIKLPSMYRCSACGLIVVSKVIRLNVKGRRDSHVKEISRAVVHNNTIVKAQFAKRPHLPRKKAAARIERDGGCHVKGAEMLVISPRGAN